MKTLRLRAPLVWGYRSLPTSPEKLLESLAGALNEFAWCTRDEVPE